MRDEVGELLPHQPLRAVMGHRSIPDGSRLLDDSAETAVLETRRPVEALEALYSRDRRHVFLEGGPTLAAAFVRAGLVDEVVAYVAPALLGAGRSAVGDLGITTIHDLRRFRLVETTVLGSGHEADVRLTLVPQGA